MELDVELTRCAPVMSRGFLLWTVLITRGDKPADQAGSFYLIAMCDAFTHLQAAVLKKQFLKPPFKASSDLSLLFLKSYIF